MHSCRISRTLISNPFPSIGHSCVMLTNGLMLKWLQVSWIRKRDLHILTVGILTYTNDQRFQSLHSDGTDEWTLKVSSPQLRDSGTYECQVSTEPKISQSFKLNVVSKWTKCICNTTELRFYSVDMHFIRRTYFWGQWLILLTYCLRRYQCKHMQYGEYGSGSGVAQSVSTGGTF